MQLAKSVQTQSPWATGQTAQCSAPPTALPVSDISTALSSHLLERSRQGWWAAWEKLWQLPHACHCVLSLPYKIITVISLVLFSEWKEALLLKENTNLLQAYNGEISWLNNIPQCDLSSYYNLCYTNAQLASVWHNSWPQWLTLEKWGTWGGVGIQPLSHASEIRLFQLPVWKQTVPVCYCNSACDVSWPASLHLTPNASF